MDDWHKNKHNWTRLCKTLLFGKMHNIFSVGCLYLFLCTFLSIKKSATLITKIVQQKKHYTVSLKLPENCANSYSTFQSSENVSIIFYQSYI